MSVECNFQQTPLTALSQSTRHKLSLMLNKKRSTIYRAEKGYQRDWRGLAILAQQDGYVEENTPSADDPTKLVLHCWCRNNPTTATIAYLEAFLGEIDRFDVWDDIYENILTDAAEYENKLKQQKDNNANNCQLKNNEYNENFGSGSDTNILTKDDVLCAQRGLPPQQYDAFVLHADVDRIYAEEMLQKLEEKNLKVFLKERDLLTGVITHVALTQLIEERCQHLIVILTKNFLKSPENEFLVQFTHAHQIECKTRKIVPVVYENDVVVPSTLRMYTRMYYTNMGYFVDFWTKLAYSIRPTPAIISNATVNQSNETSTRTTRGVGVADVNAVVDKSTTNNRVIDVAEAKSINCLGQKLLKSKSKLAGDPMNIDNHAAEQYNNNKRQGNDADRKVNNVSPVVKEDKKPNTTLLKKMFKRGRTKLIAE